MSSPNHCVIDTSVLQKANALLTEEPGLRAKFRRRVQLLQSIARREWIPLHSPKLVAEYQRQIASPRNDFVRNFLAFLNGPNAIRNWKKTWSGADREKARKCRYPSEDDHMLRTAIVPNGSTIFSEEARMAAADTCIHRRFDVHIVDPCKEPR